MIKRHLEKIVNRYGRWRTVQAALAGISVILLATAVSQIFIPVPGEQIDSPTQAVLQPAARENVSALLAGNKDETDQAIAYRSGLFKPATGLQDKPLANKTIERIKEQLKLQCVMEMNGQPVAYINIQGLGLKKCCIGDNINDLFTVLNISQQNKSVDISIVEHKVTLHL